MFKAKVNFAKGSTGYRFVDFDEVSVHDCFVSFTLKGQTQLCCNIAHLAYVEPKIDEKTGRHETPLGTLFREGR